MDMQLVVVQWNFTPSWSYSGILDIAIDLWWNDAMECYYKVTRRWPSGKKSLDYLLTTTFCRIKNAETSW